MNLVDTHAHLDFCEDLDGVLARAKAEGLNKIVTIGTSVEASIKCVEIAEKYSGGGLEIFATAGIHAEDGRGDLEKYGDKYAEELKKAAQSSTKIVGIGECGFDFRSDDVSEEEKKYQKDLFEAQIILAVDLNLPLIVHCRNAWVETFELLEKIRGTSSTETQQGRTSKSNSNLRGVFHSWTGDWDAAQKALGLGFYISFSGILTFKNATSVGDVAGRAPIDRIVLETDSPFLAPDPVRGSKNEPKNVKITAEFLAKLRGISQSEIIDVTSRNAQELFGF